jgi:hypothetical protein
MDRYTDDRFVSGELWQTAVINAITLSYGGFQPMFTSKTVQANEPSI